jgi:hypothetical protein
VQIAFRTSKRQVFESISAGVLSGYNVFDNGNSTPRTLEVNDSIRNANLLATEPRQPSSHPSIGRTVQPPPSLCFQNAKKTIRAHHRIEFSQLFGCNQAAIAFASQVIITRLRFSVCLDGDQRPGQAQRSFAAIKDGAISPTPYFPVHLPQPNVTGTGAKIQLERVPTACPCRRFGHFGTVCLRS